MPEIYSEFFNSFDNFSFNVSINTSFICWVLTAIAIFIMARKLNLKHAWRSFVPFADIYLFGKVAEQNKNSKIKYSILLLVLNIVLFVVYMVFICLAVVFILQLLVNVEEAMAIKEAITPQMFELLLPAIILLLIGLVLGIVYAVFYYIALSHIFLIFDNKNNVLFLILSIIFSFLGPIFLLIESGKQPLFEQENKQIAEELVMPEEKENEETISEEIIEPEIEE